MIQCLGMRKPASLGAPGLAGAAVADLQLSSSFSWFTAMLANNDHGAGAVAPLGVTLCRASLKRRTLLAGIGPVARSP